MYEGLGVGVALAFHCSIHSTLISVLLDKNYIEHLNSYLTQNMYKARFACAYGLSVLVRTAVGIVFEYTFHDLNVSALCLHVYVSSVDLIHCSSFDVTKLVSRPHLWLCWYYNSTKQSRNRLQTKSKHRQKARKYICGSNSPIGLLILRRTTNSCADSRYICVYKTCVYTYVGKCVHACIHTYICVEYE